MTVVQLHPDARPVDVFTNLDACLRDREVRGHCVMFDLHGLWWSVPMELNIHQIDEQIRAHLERMDCKPFASHLGDIYRPTVA